MSSIKVLARLLGPQLNASRWTDTDASTSLRSVGRLQLNFNRSADLAALGTTQQNASRSTDITHRHQSA